MPSATKSKMSTKPSKPSPTGAGPRPEDYQVVIQWSEEDGCYLATIPAWQNVRTHGATLAQASENAQEVLGMLIKDALKRGQVIHPSASEGRAPRHGDLLRPKAPQHPIGYVAGEGPLVVGTCLRARHRAPRHGRGRDPRRRSPGRPY
jgi:predicted RNase H-like HicB family nuclease